MKRLSTLLFILPFVLTSQTLSIDAYIEKFGSKYTLENFQINFGPDLQKSDLVFWGYIHGSETPQIIEHRLLEHLTEKGFRYFMPEIGEAQAFFFNRYLQSGDEQLLYFASYYQKMRTPQDASIQFLEKWQAIYQTNLRLPDEEKIRVVGVEGTLAFKDPSLAVTHLAYIAPKNSGIPMIDSLRFFKNLDILDLNIVSGKPVLELALANDKPTYDYVYPTSSKYQFGKRFISFYKENQELVNNAFGRDIHDLLIREELKREQIIYKNFKKKVLPSINSGGKVFSVFGYAHVLQGSINKYDYIAGLIKKNHELKVTSILGVLAKSKALKNRKSKKSEVIYGPLGHKFTSTEYSGFSTSKSYDGDSYFEKLEGINHLRKNARKYDIISLPLMHKNSPFNQNLTFLMYKRGGKWWRPDEELATIDYIQYLIYIQNSRANTPMEEWSN